MMEKQPSEQNRDIEPGTHEPTTVATGVEPEMPAAGKSEVRHNPPLLLNLGINVALPAIIMGQLSSEHRLGPVVALIIALSLPLGYGLWELARHRRFNAFSIIGLVSLVLTGGVSLLHLPLEWVVVKEAGVPLLIGLVLTGSELTRWPLATLFLGQFIDLARIEAGFAGKGKERLFHRTFRGAAMAFGASFFISAALNYILATTMLKSEPGTAAFVSELGRMTAFSLPAIMVPMFIVTFSIFFFLIWSIQRHTDLKVEDAFRS
ncbi:VC0807 family protein [Radicibacter daui]|uniref:VC0807 family protein n=1 Tax=Radicibacter daui TaxID=3064829 RepID=UPI00404693FC